MHPISEQQVVQTCVIRYIIIATKNVQQTPNTPAHV